VLAALAVAEAAVARGTVRGNVGAAANDDDTFTRGRSSCSWSGAPAINNNSH